MSFLAPWFFAGAAAIALPIIFHLVRQSIRKKKLFSSLMFLKPTPPKIKRRNRLENILLLILRCALLLLLAAAFTRPFFKQPGEAATGETSNEVVAVLIDTSASMQRGSTWDEAMDLAADVFDEVESLSSVALMSFDRQTRTMLSFEEWARTQPSQRSTLWKERMSVLEPGYAGTSLGTALITAAEQLEDARSRNETQAEPAPGRLIVISDLQEGAATDGLAGFNWPSRVRVEIRSPEYRSQSNAGLHPVASDPNAILSLHQTNAARVFISNADDSNKEMFTVEWIDANNERLQGSEQVYLPPGRSRVAKMPVLTNSVADRIRLSGDDEAFDNVIHVVPDKPQEIRIVSITDGVSTDPQNLSFFLKNAFQSTTRQTIRFTNVTSAAALPEETIDLLITTADTDAAPVITRQLENGQSVLLVMKEGSSGSLLSDLLGAGSMDVTEGQQRNYALFGKIDFEHPLFAPFLDSRFSDFTSIQFWKYRRLNPDQLPDARVLAEFDTGDPALLEIPRLNGSLFVLTTTWRQTDGRLALSSKFVPLLYSLLELNRPPQIQGESLVVGDTIATAGGGMNASVTGPDGDEWTDITPASTFDRPGIFTLSEPNQPDRLIAVNISPSESRTAPLPEEDLIRLGVPLSGLNVESDAARLAREIQQKDTETEAQQKNWRWLLAVAVGIFLLESWLSGRSGTALATDDSAPA